MHVYKVISLIKIVIGLATSILVYSFINVYEDPIVWLGLGFLWIFIFAWGASFFVFLAFQRRFRDAKMDDMMKDSYKLSLLFGIYVIINLLLISLWYRSKRLGIWLFIWFVFLQVFLFMGFWERDDEQF